MDIEDYTPGEQPENEPRSRRMEMLAGVALFVAVIGFVLFNYVKGEMQIGHYHAGVDALGGGDLDLAITELQASDGYLDSGTLIENAKTRIEDRDALYKEATDFASVGKWWQASRSILDMQAVQAKYKDSDALLARAREVNGGIFFTHMPPNGRLTDGTTYSITDTPDLDGMYSMQADGGQADQIPDTVRASQTYAVSPDGQNLVYSIPGESPRLYNFGSGWITQLVLPGADASREIEKVVFSENGKSLAIVTADTAFIFDMGKALTKGTDRGPVAQESRAEYEKRQLKTLVLDTNAAGETLVGIRSYESDEPKVLSVERGHVDGAVFSKNQHYLMYRTCTLTNGNENFECTLKLADLTATGVDVQTIARVPDLALSSFEGVLTGEFTRDGAHYVLFMNFRNSSETVLYNIETREANKLDPETFGLTTGRGKEDVYVSGDDYLTDDYMPGLEEWQGRNSLGRTAQNLQRPTDHYAKVKSHWISVSPNEKFVLALGSHITESARYYRLMSTHLTWNSTDAPEKGRLLFSTKSLPREWLPSMRTLGDGYTVAASVTGDREQLPSIYAFNLDKEGQSNVLLMKDARMLEAFAFPNVK